MLIRKSVAAALFSVVIAAPAAAGEAVVGPKFLGGSDGWQRVAQVEAENPLPPKKLRKKQVEEAAPDTEPGPADPVQKKVRKTAPQAPASGVAIDGVAPSEPAKKRVRKGESQQATPETTTDVETPETFRKRVRKNGTEAPEIAVEPEAPLSDPMPRKFRKIGPKGPQQNVVIEVETPSSDQILRKLEAPAANAPMRTKRVTIREFKRRPELRRAAPSIDIQSINFAFASAEIPFSQYRKVENIATALDRLLRRRPDSRILIEGHTDAVGSDYSNQTLSEARAASLRRMLVREFGIPGYAMETVGYGEDFLLVPTRNEDWRNRRVTLRRIDDFIQ